MWPTVGTVPTIDRYFEAVGEEGCALIAMVAMGIANMT